MRTVRPDDLPPEWLDRTSIVHLTDHGDISRLEFARPSPPTNLLYEPPQISALAADDWRTRPMLDVTEEIGLILDDLAEHPSKRQQAADALVELYNRHIDHHQRRVRCTAVIVQNNAVIGYTLGSVPFDLDGHPLCLNSAHRTVPLAE